jgi:POT family proton-dependent oligopeptide transporter
MTRLGLGPVSAGTGLVGSYLLLGLGDILLPLWFLPLALAHGIQAQTVQPYDDVSQPVCFGVNGAVAVAAGPAVPASARWLRRTRHPVR